MNGVFLRYDLEQQTGTNGSVSVAFTTRSDSSASTTVSSLAAATSYRYRLVVVTTVGSAASAWVGSRTRDGIPTGIAIISIDDLQSTSFRVLWATPTALNGVILRYDVLVDGVVKRSVSGVDVTVRSLVITEVSMDATMEVSVRACTVTGCGSTTRTVHTPLGVPLPITPSAFLQQPKFVEFQWEPVRTTARFVLLQRDNSSGSAVVTVLYNGTGSQYVDEGLTPGHLYEYSLISINTVGKCIDIQPCGMSPTFSS